MGGEWLPEAAVNHTGLLDVGDAVENRCGTYPK